MHFDCLCVLCGCQWHARWIGETPDTVVFLQCPQCGHLGRRMPYTSYTGLPTCPAGHNRDQRIIIAPPNPNEVVGRFIPGSDYYN